MNLVWGMRVWGVRGILEPVGTQQCDALSGQPGAQGNTIALHAVLSHMESTADIDCAYRNDVLRNKNIAED